MNTVNYKMVQESEEGLWSDMIQLKDLEMINPIIVYVVKWRCNVAFLTENEMNFLSSMAEMAKLIPQWSESPVWPLMEEIYGKSTKLTVVKHFKSFSGLGLRESKFLCDKLLFDKV